MDIRTTKLIFKALAITGVPVTGYLAARGGRTKAELLLKGETPGTRPEQALLNAKAYGPAVAAGAGTIAAIFMTDYFAGKELAAAGAITAAVVANKNRIKDQFEKYRGVVKEEDGQQKDTDIMQKASAVRFDEDGNAIHRYCLDWLETPIYFESTAENVAQALTAINKELVDLAVGWGVVTVSDALRFFGHEELATPETDIAGWSYSLLNVDYECYFLGFSVMSGQASLWHGDPDPNVRVITVDIPPEENLEKAMEEAKGRI